MSVSPECFYTGRHNRAIAAAKSDLALFSLRFAGCERAQNAVELKRALSVERGLAQKPLQVLQHQLLVAGSRVACPTAALIRPLADFFSCRLEHCAPLKS
jgi:hypothetical protein